MTKSYDAWLNDVRASLNSINMPIDEWQKNWPFDFSAQYNSGTNPVKAAENANRFWWHEQNKAISQNCLQNKECWLPRNHQGACQPVEG
jgi:hypothetical protein